MTESPKILALDIETLFNTVGTWGLFNQNVFINQILSPNRVLCWAAKWVGGKEIKFAKYDDSHFLTGVHALLDEADAVLTYNGRSFDIPHLNREFLKAGMAPPSPFKHIDLFLTVRKQFNFPSNKMEFVCQELDIGSKTAHEGFPLWIKCAEGDAQAWKTMCKYNKQDVKLLEKLYDKLRPWCAGLPNSGLLTDLSSPVCPVCGSDHLHRRGYHRTATQTYARFQCQVCLAWSRARFTEIDKDKRANVLVQSHCA